MYWGQDQHLIQIKPRSIFAKDLVFQGRNTVNLIFSYGNKNLNFSTDEDHDVKHGILQSIMVSRILTDH